MLSGGGTRTLHLVAVPGGFVVSMPVLGYLVNSLWRVSLETLGLPQTKVADFLFCDLSRTLNTHFEADTCHSDHVMTHCVLTICLEIYVSSCLWLCVANSHIRSGIFYGKMNFVKE